MWVRLRTTKVGKIRWTSHRDTARIWERAFRRAEIAVAYSVGFTPRPRISFGLALPTGSESLCEYLDVDVAVDADTAHWPDRLTACLPVGLTVVRAVPLAPGTPSAQSDVMACDWTIDVSGATPAVATSLVDQALAATSLVVARRKKDGETQQDVRPTIEHLTVTGAAADGNGVLLFARLATKPTGLRPHELRTYDV